MKDRRPLVVLVIAMVVMVGLTVFVRSGDDASFADSEGSTTATTQNFGRGPDAIAPDVSDWAQGIDRVTALENEVFQAPDPTRVGEFMTRGCSCYKQTQARLADFKNKGYRVAGDNIVITDARLIEQIGPNVVKVFVGLRSDGKATVDSSGAVVTPSPSEGVPAFIYTMQKQDGTWLIADRQFEREAKR